MHFEKLVGQWERWPWKKPLRVWEDLGEDVITCLGKISGLSENIGINSFQGDFIQTEWESNHNYGSGGCFGMLTLTSGILLSTRKLSWAEQGGSEKSMAFQCDVNMLQPHGIFQKELRWILKPILLA